MWPIYVCSSWMFAVWQLRGYIVFLLSLHLKSVSSFTREPCKKGPNGPRSWGPRFPCRRISSANWVQRDSEAWFSRSETQWCCTIIQLSREGNRIVKLTFLSSYSVLSPVLDNSHTLSSFQAYHRRKTVPSSLSPIELVKKGLLRVAISFLSHTFRKV